MEGFEKIGCIEPKCAADVAFSRLGLGFEKLDRGAFDPEKAYDKVAALGVKWIRIQSGWARTETRKGRIRLCMAGFHRGSSDSARPSPVDLPVLRQWAV